MYINRQLEVDIKPFLAKKEVISIIGPRQAGKLLLLKIWPNNLKTTTKQ